jgi:hypothetical protein
MIDFDRILKAPNGKPIVEPKVDDAGNVVGSNDLTLGVLCYAALTSPQQGDDRLPMKECFSLAKLAAKISVYGAMDLSVEETNLLISRVTKASFVPVCKAAAVMVLDPKFKAD